MNESILSNPSPAISAAREEALRRARKKARDIRGFYFSALLYALIIPIFWIMNLSMGGTIWAHWPMIGWGIGLIIQGLSLFAGRTVFGAEWEEKKVEELMARENLKSSSYKHKCACCRHRLNPIFYSTRWPIFKVSSGGRQTRRA
jgi:hypothetical protein